MNSTSLQPREEQAMDSMTVDRIAADLADVLSRDKFDPPIARKADADPMLAPALPYVAWITPAGGTPQRVRIDAVRSKEEALELAKLAAKRLFGGRAFDAMVRPA